MAILNDREANVCLSLLIYQPIYYIEYHSCLVANIPLMDTLSTYFELLHKMGASDTRRFLTLARILLIYVPIIISRPYRVTGVDCFIGVYIMYDMYMYDGCHRVRNSPL